MFYTIFAYTSWLAAHGCCAVQAMALSRAPGFRAGLSSPPLDLAVHLAEMQGCGPGTLTGLVPWCAWMLVVVVVVDEIGVVVKEHGKRVVG